MAPMQCIGIIPARYGSTRFPGKPLALIQGKTMIQRVYEQAQQCGDLQQVVVATDDERIFHHVKTFGQVVMTSPHHPSGTDRCLEAVNLLDPRSGTDPQAVIINIQGDEPFIEPLQISLLARAFQQPSTQIATLIKPVAEPDELLNPNVVKVVISQQGQAMYFSRQAIPFLRGVPQEEWMTKTRYYKHIGLYAYRYGILKRLSTLPPSSYEQAESLEQLRWLQNGFPITTLQTDHQALAVDTPEDLEKINQKYSG